MKYWQDVLAMSFLLALLIWVVRTSDRNRKR